jgi:hypothetical protein
VRKLENVILAVTAIWPRTWPRGLRFFLTGCLAGLLLYTVLFWAVTS